MKIRKLLRPLWLSGLAAIGLSASGCGHVAMQVYKSSWEKEMTRQYAPIKQAAAREEARRAERFAAAGPGAMLRLRIRGGTMDLGGRAAITPVEVHFARGVTRPIRIFHQKGPYQEAVEMRFSGDGETFVFDATSDRPLTISVLKGQGVKVVAHANDHASPQGVTFELAVSGGS